MAQIPSMSGAAIIGWGSAVPNKVVTNDDMAKYLDTSDEWIAERTGIRERRIGGTTSGLATEAGELALSRANLTGADIDLVILATSTPDQVMPGSATVVQHNLGIKGGAVDVNAACSGFVYATSLAHGMILGGMRNVLVIGSDTLSAITDQDDRSTAVLFADGAGAVVMSARPQDHLLATDLGSDGSLRGILNCDNGGTIYMQGKDVYKEAVLMVVQSIKSVCAQAGVSPGDVNLFVAHQANVRIIHAVMDRLGMAHERAAIVLDRTGNTSAASIPLALDDAIRKDMINDGELVLFCGFGAGMTWASQIWRWEGK